LYLMSYSGVVLAANRSSQKVLSRLLSLLGNAT
jgi:hypothetical protein